MDRYYVRLCWNSEGWQGPTREVKDRKLERWPSYVLRQGFGHEEWLFDFTEVWDGYQYGFLQPIHKGHSFQGRTLDVVLYALSPTRKRVLIGEISRVEILTPKQQKDALSASVKSGRKERMRKDLLLLDVGTTPLDIPGLFNVRFKRDNVMLQDAPYPELIPRAHFKKLKRYSMFPALPGPVKSKLYAVERTRLNLPDSRSHMRKAILAVMVTDRHLQLQHALRNLLNQHFGSKYVFVEENGIDLAVRKGERRMLIEIKSHSNIKHVLREALGQVIEYNHWPTRTVDHTDIYIVSPAAETIESQRYVKLLRNKYKLPIGYCSFSVGDTLPQALR